MTSYRNYLKRLQLTSVLERGVEALQQFHERHLLTIPFENLDIHRGRPIVFTVRDKDEWQLMLRRESGISFESSLGDHDQLASLRKGDV